MSDHHSEKQTDKKDAHHDSGHGHHYILPDKTAYKTVGSLLVLTAITVWTAGIDFGHWNFPLAMLIASVKALIVVTIFMNLRKDSAENSVIFGTSFLFLFIFIGFTATDLFFRGDVMVKGPLSSGGGAAQFKKPWIASDAIMKHGKELFSQQCTSCHGDAGLGNGPAAGGLNPPPRNFTALTGWKNGHKPSQIFKTLKEGIPGTSMASFATLAAEDRWAIAHYVAALNPKPEKDETKDWVAVGVDPSKDTMDGNAARTITIEQAMAKLTVATPTLGRVAPRDVEDLRDDSRPGAALYAQACASCHGVKGEGTVLRQSGTNPKSFIRVPSLAGSNAVASSDSFKQVVVNGIPGDLMPGFGSFSSSQIAELQSYIRAQR